MPVCSLKISGQTLLINGNNEAVSIVPWSWPPVSSRGDTRDQTCKRCLAMFVVESKSKILNKSLRSYLGTNVSTNCLYLRFEHLSLFNSIPNFIKHRLHVWSWLIGGWSPLPLTMMTVTLSGHLASPPSVLATSGGQQEKREEIDRYFIRIKAAETPATCEGHLLILWSNAFFKYWM